MVHTNTSRDLSYLCCVTTRGKMKLQLSGTVVWFLYSASFINFLIYVFCTNYCPQNTSFLLHVWINACLCLCEMHDVLAKKRLKIIKNFHHHHNKANIFYYELFSHGTVLINDNFSQVARGSKSFCFIFITQRKFWLSMLSVDCGSGTISGSSKNILY